MATPMYRCVLAAIFLLLAGACRGPSVDLESERTAVAERYFRGVYGSDASVVDDLASDDIVVSYPFFESLFGLPAIRGREAVKEFATRFGQKWIDPEVEFHEAIVDGDRVVLLWSFRARDAAPLQSGQAATNQEHRWGGITLIRFDDVGRIVLEVGEESEPGPTGRLGRSRPE